MSSNASAGALELHPRPSRVLARWIILVHGMAALAAVSALVHDLLLCPLLAVVAVSLWWTWRDCLRGPCPGDVRRLSWQADSTWLATDRRGNTWRARLLPSSYVHPQLLVLRLSAPGRRRHFNVILCRDSERAATLRALRRRLMVERRRLSSTQWPAAWCR